MTTSLNSFTCYDAVTRDDPQFDGRFFTAVLTTGIFCRPTCKAQTPRAENVRFFATAAAAAESGFRPCLRCKPESAPDPTQWQSTSPVVARALRLIGQGILDESSVGELARRLNVSARQLRRLFLEELGAPPVAVAQTRRLLFAKKLIDETNLTMAEVASSAGYGSVRRFNDAIRQTYGRTPTELRSKRRRAVLDPTGTTVELKLFYRAPYNWPAVMAFFRTQAIPGVEAVDTDGYRRTITLDGAVGTLQVRPLPEERAVRVRVSSHLSRYLLPITEKVKDMFDLRADPFQVDAHLASDPLLSPLIHKQRGMRVPGVWDGFELAVRAALHADPGGRGDRAVRSLLDGCGGDAPSTTLTGLTHVFPEPERLVDADLTKIGLTEVQSEAVRVIARAVIDGTLDFSGTMAPGAVTELLSTIPGLRDHDIQLIAMGALRETDLLPARLVAKGEFDGDELRARSEQWQPWRSYATMYLWVARTLRATSPNTSPSEPVAVKAAP